MKTTHLNAFLTFFTLTAAAHADAPNTEFEDRLHSKYPTTVNSSVTRAFPGFWSVVKNGEVVYINDDLTYLINGEVIDLETKQSLTQQLKAESRPKIDVSRLPITNAIKISEGKHKIYVFSDPDCPYCKRVEASLNQVDDVAVYVFPYPLVSLHPNAENVAINIWCQPDKSKAWRDYVEHTQLPSSLTCENPISKNIQLAETLGINGTPALIFEDGTLVPGAIDTDQIKQIVSQINSKGSEK